MMTRYQRLRNAVAILAAPPEQQAEYLDQLFVPCTGGGSAEAYGNDELVLGLDDIFAARGHMMDFGELKASEIAVIEPLNDLFLAYSQPVDVAFWKREALFDDARWQTVRDIATNVLSQLPNEARESDYTRGLEDG